MSRRTLALVLAALCFAACRTRSRPVRIGSKNFSEQVLLAEILVQQDLKRELLGG